jgi:hypothetical protein
MSYLYCFYPADDAGDVERVPKTSQYSGLTLSGTPTLFFQAHHFCRNFIYEFLMMTWQNSHPQKIG